MKLVDEKQMKTTQDLKRLEDSLCYERQNTMNEISRRKSAELKCREFEIRNENANLSSSVGGRKWIEKLELKIRDLEAELEVEKRKGRDAVKMERQMERHFKDGQKSWQPKLSAHSKMTTKTTSGDNPARK